MKEGGGGAEASAPAEPGGGPWWPVALVGAAALAAGLVDVTESIRSVTSDPTLVARVFEDDAAYYFEVADRIVASGRSTFDGLTPTNGYHPLWMALLVALRFAAGPSHAPFLSLVLVASALAVGAAALAFAAVARRWLPGSPYAVLAALPAIAHAAGLQAVGMETTLALPLLAWWTLRLSDEAVVTAPRRALALGLLGGALVLARLDSALLVALAWLLVVAPAPAPWEQRARATAALGLGLCVVVAPYLAWNTLHYGSPVPISGMAKHLDAPRLLDARPFAPRVFTGWWRPCLALFPVGLGLLAWASRRGGFSHRRRVQLWALAAPVAFYATNTLSSDWLLWRWYQYPIPLAALALCALGWELLVPRSLAPPALRRPAVVAALLGVAMLGATVVFVLRLRHMHYSPERAALARGLAAFTARRPGLYAMGDLAGMAAYLTREPIFQTEGLVADRALLESIRRRAELGAVLRARGVAYFVDVNREPLARTDGCYRLETPHAEQAGRSPTLRGRVCRPALFEETYPGSDGRTAYVFAVSDFEPPAAAP